jgi:hypothetical protein
MSIAFLMALSFFSVRAEPVEALPFLADEKSSPSPGSSPGSGRTVEGTTPIDAERAFAADAKAIGQWTAFRKWSTGDAVMFVPQSVNAHEFLKDRKDPPQPIDWWPTASYISCDGTLAVNTGGWKRPNGSVGYFTTVWQRQPDATWRWLLDSGDTLSTPRAIPKEPIVWRAACSPARWPVSVWVDPDQKGGCSADGSLRWTYRVDKNGGRFVSAEIWNGVMNIWVIDDKIPAPLK